ncbi:hypothetical protein JB92DRAFT_2729412, partial [Gautieria morchelliformis]
YLIWSCGVMGYGKRCQDTGISRLTLVLCLSQRHWLPITASPCGECMHVPTLNLGDLLLPL